MNMFRLDLNTLLAFLEESRQSGMLSTTLPGGVLGQKGQSQVVIRLVAGKVVDCHVEYSDGQIYVLNNSSLHRLLDPLDAQEWRLETLANSHDSASYRNNASIPPSMKKTQPLPTPATVQWSQIVPKAIIHVRPDNLNRLSHKQRRVLVLVDGMKNVGQINSLLFPMSHDLQIIIEVLRELEYMGIISIKMPNR